MINSHTEEALKEWYKPFNKKKLKPLTDDEIDNILNSEEADSGGSHRFARAIEKAHGIE